jgi:hypothetical protein
MDFLDSYSDLITGMLIGMGIAALYISYKMAAILNDVEEYLENIGNKVTEQVMEILVEKNDGIYYCYSESNKQFVCQGRNIEEIKKAFDLIYPGKLIYITDGEDSVLKELSAMNT